MAVLLALAAALAYGVSDFIAGLASRRTSAWPVAVAAATGALLGATIIAVAFPGDPAAGDFAWGALAGVGSGIGSAFLYRGLSLGRMGVVAPISAVGAAVVPVLVGVATGERPDPLVWLGILAAVPAIWLVSKEPVSSTGPAAGVLDGVLAGVGFGVLFAATGQIGEDAGYWPLVATQVASMLIVVALAVSLRQAWAPRAPSDWWGAVAGLLATLAVLGFLLAAQRGLLAVAAVLASLYPAATVVLAVLVLREHVHRAQALGLGLCAVAVVLVAAG
ncbi:EamA family transporter [uncultured Nocardioides sp.]|uniref:EamA family transporter n=1 Tax=uncultured Nocardioides sp. TaxID=198441 RepID=UPI0025CCF09A|nr:EamA family transporter [uncultured Nocardioides sp.]